MWPGRDVEFEWPFIAWICRGTPGWFGRSLSASLVVQRVSYSILFQLGDDQICVFEPTRKRVALLWRGRGPVAVVSRVSPGDERPIDPDMPCSAP